MLSLPVNKTKYIKILQYLWLFISIQSAPYKLLLIFSSSRIYVRPTPDPKRVKIAMEGGVEPLPPHGSFLSFKILFHEDLSGVYITPHKFSPKIKQHFDGVY